MLDLFRYDIPNFIRNIFVFRKALWNYRSFDYSGMMMFMEESAKDMAECHENYGNLVRSKQTAKELRILSEIFKRINDDEYFFNKGKYVHNGKGILGFNFVQKENQFPKHKSKSFHKLVEQQKKDELKLACKIIERKLFTFWD